ncbi:hypothetical protein KP509_01G077400 [Ceratopteris richardii]|uniref:Uncharacterized protein n=1 Tax=Ceratopteris richardii TaxID=49495 RepID=A0A8T2VQV4_CERRI|nr:hypothetical protein KP509_01G077400 [Ceratopteris richardii]
METSLRYNSEEKQLYLHAKECFLIDSSFYLKAHGRLNTHTGLTGGTIQFRRRFTPKVITSLDVGGKYDIDGKEFSYDIQAKKTLPITETGLLSLDIRAGYNFNPGLKFGKPRGVVELNYKIFNFTEEQDVRLRVGYNPFQRVTLLANKGEQLEFQCRLQWELECDV